MEQIKSLMRIIWFPLFILTLIVFAFIYIGGVSIKEGLIGAFGGALVGVMLGFIAEMIREGIKEFQLTKRDKKIYLKLLEEDAKDAHRSVWLYTGLMKDPRTPQEVKNHIPAEFDLRYWSQLSKERDFLRFGTEHPFDKVFNIMWNLEKVNYQIQEAKIGRPQAAQFAFAFYQLLIEEEETKKLLLNFMNENEIKEMENNWLEKAKERGKKS